LIEAGRDTDAYQRFHRALIRETPTLWSITDCWRIAPGMAKRPLTTGNAPSTSIQSSPTRNSIQHKLSVNKENCKPRRATTPSWPF
jgi:hypothetical protein